MKKEDYEIEIASGKKRPLFTMELWFKNDNEICRWHIVNQSWEETRAFRETVFTHGFFLQRDVGRGEVIFPCNLVKLLIDIQPKGWYNRSPEIQKMGK